MDSAQAAAWLSAVATLATAIIAALAAYIGIRTFQHQRTASDIQLALTVFDDINRYWDRIIDSESKNYDYDMGQVLSHFEVAAALFNKKILTKNALPILKDHIVEVFASIAGTSDGERLIKACCSSPDTFKELRSFLREHSSTALQSLSFREDLFAAT